MFKLDDSIAPSRSSARSARRIGVQAGRHPLRRHVQEYGYWTARCDDGRTKPRDWAIFIGADDSAQVRLCEDTKAVGLPACAAKAGTEGGSGIAERKKRAGRTDPLLGHSARRRQSQLRLSLYSPVGAFSLIVTQVPCLSSSRQLPSALTWRCSLGDALAVLDLVIPALRRGLCGALRMGRAAAVAASETPRRAAITSWHFASSLLLAPLLSVEEVKPRLNRPYNAPARKFIHAVQPIGGFADTLPRPPPSPSPWRRATTFASTARPRRRSIQCARASPFASTSAMACACAHASIARRNPSVGGFETLRQPPCQPRNRISRSARGAAVRD